MRAAWIAIVFALSPTVVVAGAMPILRDGPLQARHLALDVPRGFEWLELWPCGWQNGSGEIRHFVIQKSRRGQRPYRPPLLTIDVTPRAATLDSTTDDAWQRAFAAADEEIAGRVVIDHTAQWRTGTMKQDRVKMRVALLLRIIDGDAYSIQVVAPASDKRAWAALVAAAKSSRRELPKPTTARPDPFCAER